jgi:hypothetical protein
MQRSVLNLIAFLFLILILPALSIAGDDSLTLVPERKIKMGLGFGGETITFHGILPQPGADLVVRVTSESNPPLKLSRKDKVVFFWMNVKQFEISNVPFYYKIFSSKKLSQILNEDLNASLKIGYEALKDAVQIKILKGTPADDDHQVVFEGLLKLKEKLGLYQIKDDFITINGDRFSFDLDFSDRTIEGNYIIECWAIKDGIILGKTEEKITAEKVGISKWLTNLALHHSVFYGIFAVIVAISVGLLVGFIFKGKTGH